MLGIIKNLFGTATVVDYVKLIKEGAVIIDVRTIPEYYRGHIEGSINIPLDQLRNNLDKFENKNQVIITCCASGARSGVAKDILQLNGYKNVYNGGSWSRLKQIIES